MNETFEHMLTGGHHNSLGRTVEVTETVLENPGRLIDAYRCYFSEDEVVRLRTSSVFKRIAQAQPEWLVPYIDRFINEISKIDQASTQWTMAILFDLLKSYMSDHQKTAAVEIVKNNLENHTDWIVLNYSMQTLFDWDAEDTGLRLWLVPHLERLSQDKRKSVAKRASKLLTL